MCNQEKCDYQESVTIEQTDTQTDRPTDAIQSDPYVPLCFAGDTTKWQQDAWTDNPTLILSTLQTGDIKTIWQVMDF